MKRRFQGLPLSENDGAIPETTQSVTSLLDLRFAKTYCETLRLGLVLTSLDVW